MSMDEEDYIEVKIKMNRRACKEFRQNMEPIDDIPRIVPTEFYVDGDLSGDINWNNINANIYLRVHAPKELYSPESAQKYKRKYGCLPFDFQFEAQVSPFTNNCGVKALHHLRAGKNDVNLKKKFLEYVESFLYYCCNCGIIVGSDYIQREYDTGATYRYLRDSGTDYVFTPEVWNPNYTETLNHNIFLFYKYLDATKLPNYWG